MLVFGLQPVEFLHRRRAGGFFLLGHLHGLALKTAQARRVAVGEVDSSRDPLPAFPGELLRFGLELLIGKPVEKRGILEPAAPVVLEQVAGDAAAGCHIGFDADEDRAPVRGADGAFGQKPADVPGLLVVALLDRLPDLLLTGMVLRDGEGHELLQRHLLGDVGLDQLFRDGDKAQALLDHRRGHEEARGDLLLGEALVDQRPEGAELVDGVQRLALRVLRERILLGDAVFLDDAGHGRGLREPFRLDQALERPVAPAARRHLVHAGWVAVGALHGTDTEALQQAASGDVLGKLLDRDAGLDRADVRLAEHEAVERDVPRRRETDLLDGLGHFDGLQ